MTSPRRVDPLEHLACYRCKRAIGVRGSPIVYLGPPHDPDRLIPLCVGCAILGCFRCGLKRAG